MPTSALLPSSAGVSVRVHGEIETMEPRPHSPRTPVSEALLAAQVTIEVRDPDRIFSNLARSRDEIQFPWSTVRLAGEAFAEDSALANPCASPSALNMLRGGERLVLQFPLSRRFATHDRGAIASELSQRLLSSCGDTYGAFSATEYQGCPAIWVSRRTEMEGFIFDEQVAVFSYLPAGWIAFTYVPQCTVVCSAPQVAAESTTALKILKDFVDSHFRLSNELPPPARLVLGVGALD